MFNKKCFFSTFNAINNSKILMGFDSSSLAAIRREMARLVDCNGVTWMLNNSLYVPKLNTNLVALSQLASQITIQSKNGYSNIFLNNEAKSSFFCPMASRVVETKIKLNSVCLSTISDDPWLQILEHPNERETKKLIQNYSKNGMNCNECAKGKLTEFHFSHSFQPVSHPLEVFHMNLCGPIQTQSLSGARYFMILINQFTGFVTIKFLNNKSEAFQVFKNFTIRPKVLHGRKVLKTVSDGGKEFDNNQFKQLAKESGFKHWNSPPYTPEHNGVAKRSNRYIIEKTRCLLQQANLADQFWPEVASTATCLHNQTPKNDAILLYETWFGFKPCMDKLRSFVCKALVRIPLATHFSIFGAVAWEDILLRYENHALAYRILRISDKRVIISRHVKFDESCFPALIYSPIKNPLNTRILHFFSNLPFYCSSTHGDTANEVDDCSVVEEVFHDDLEEQPTQRIRVIGPRHPTLISSNVTTDNILSYKRRAHRTTKSTVPKTYEEATKSEQCEG
ncbi:hypothetical protein O181_122201 [Austropuccinia psidii MF-1]|uniref:Integrase catalytic domain-containing protein n=1 Tax=Austropuccinia psidii MF-1 TaxID=1389203 RepID=A0A9Q3Q249_9BASI|nr:hypothetical protein [Austropuccinia psidii MF-1]